MNMLLLLLALLWPARVQDKGHCADVTNPECVVRDFFPRSRRIEATGEEAYWLSNANGQVCFVTRTQYADAVIGRDAECLWRDRLP